MDREGLKPTFRTPAPMPWDFRASAQPDLKVYDLGHLGLPPLPLGAPGGAGAGPWSSTWPPVTRPRFAYLGHSDITSWSKGGAECGL